MLAVAAAAALGLSSSPAPAEKPVHPMAKMMQDIDRYAKAGNASYVADMMKFIARAGPASGEFAGWAGYARQAQVAAKRGDLATARQACDQCHAKYRELYKSKIDSKIPENLPKK